MSPPRKHHYLPRFYLRGFSHDSKHIFQVDKRTGRSILGSLKDIGAIRDFHVDDGEGTPDPQHVEKALADLESAHASDLKALLKDGVTNLAALGETVGFLSMLRMRVPAVKDYIQSSLSSQSKANFQAMVKSGKIPSPPMGFEHLLNPKKLKFEVLNWKCVEIMLKMACDERNVSALARMRATLISSPEGYRFITGDQPVSLFLPSANPQDLYGVGPNHSDVVISLPLASDKLLTLDNKSGPHQERVASPQEVQEYNRRTIIMAKNYIFCSEGPDLLRTPIRQCKGIRAGFTYSDGCDEFGFLQSHLNIAIGPKPNPSLNSDPA